MPEIPLRHDGFFHTPRSPYNSTSTCTPWGHIDQASVCANKIFKPLFAPLHWGNRHANTRRPLPPSCCSRRWPLKLNFTGRATQQYKINFSHSFLYRRVVFDLNDAALLERTHTHSKWHKRTRTLNEDIPTFYGAHPARTDPLRKLCGSGVIIYLCTVSVGHVAVPTECCAGVCCKEIYCVRTGEQTGACA